MSNNFPNANELARVVIIGKKSDLAKMQDMRSAAIFAANLRYGNEVCFVDNDDTPIPGHPELVAIATQVKTAASDE